MNPHTPTPAELADLFRPDDSQDGRGCPVAAVQTMARISALLAHPSVPQGHVAVPLVWEGDQA